MKDRLTNEALKSLYKSNFDLTNYAIKLGEYLIKSGKEVNVDELLEEIRRHPHGYTLKELQEPPRREDMEE